MPQVKNLVGERFNKLVVIERVGTRYGGALWLCQCDCGGTRLVRTGELTSGHTKSCGCTHHIPNVIYSMGDVSICLMESKKRGKDYFWFDTDLLNLVEGHQWHPDKDGYATTTLSGANRPVRLHRLVLGLGKDESTILVDHINGDVRDNRKSNLRRCSYAQNSRHRRAVAGYRKTPWGTYQASILVGGKRVCLGSYDTPEEAHAAYNGAAIIAFGDFRAYEAPAIYYLGCDNE